MPVRPPSAEQLLEIAKHFGMKLTRADAESFRGLIETKYGIILSIKLALVLLLLGLAALNRFRLTPALASVPRNTPPLVRSILLERASASRRDILYGADGIGNRR